ncbi:MAG: hypothetical protein A3G93_02840 [Nitrospinae bacterium RIFCSPLOWO2_12_FULL_45_22]|nr:MAG: hypothetical protein A3G93_02840 [Nitrospinae bacterium RIFCSPLOWO2_12_FULL_45_22]
MPNLGNRNQQAGGYSYSYSEETIREYMQWSAKMKLDWLEEANRFLYRNMPPENRLIWERFRRGEKFEDKSHGYYTSKAGRNKGLTGK